MSHTHDHDRSNVRREASAVRSAPLQDAYRKELASRFRKLRGVLRRTIVDNDALRIKGGARQNVEEPESEPDIDSREDFEFDNNAAKQVAFRQQIQEWIDEGILEPKSQEEIEEGQHYTAIYVGAAYEQGLSFGEEYLAREGEDVAVPVDGDRSSLVSRPIHASTLEQLYTRNYQGLEGITEDMDRSLSRVLSESLRDGLGTGKTATAITGEVRDIQHTRARTLARTETLNARNEGTRNRYEDYGVEEVEILTHTPCPICQRLEADDPYPIDEAPRLPLDTHPNCVCTYAPVL